MTKMNNSSTLELDKRIRLDLHLYKLDQAGTQQYIMETLDRKGINYETYRGNIFSIRFPGRPLFVSHMDTVDDLDMSGKLRVTDRVLYRKGSRILGADDKAGVNILMNFIDEINFVFTVDEEKGCVGANALLFHNPFMLAANQCSCAIEYDRTNATNLIEYCGKQLTQDIVALTHYYPANGLYTDVTVWEDEIPGVNLSVGYYKHHTNAEYLVLDEWRMAASTLPILNTSLKEAYDVSLPKSDYVGPYGWASNYDSADEYWDTYYENNYMHSYTCSYCQTRSSKTNYFEDSDGQFLCEDCVSHLYGLRRMG